MLGREKTPCQLITESVCFPISSLVTRISVITRMPRNEYVHIHVVGPLDASRSDFSDSIASKHGIECRNRRKRVYNQACSAGSSACGMCKGSSCAHSSSRLRYRRFRWVKYMYTCIHVCSKYRENEKVRKTDKNYQSGTLKSHFFR